MVYIYGSFLAAAFLVTDSSEDHCRRIQGDGERKGTSFFAVVTVKGDRYMVIVALKIGGERYGNKALFTGIMELLQCVGILKLYFPCFSQLHLIPSVIKDHTGVFHVQIIASARFNTKMETGVKRIPVP